MYIVSAYLRYNTRQEWTQQERNTLDKKGHENSRGVSQCRGCFLGRTSESGPSEARQASFLASENEEWWNRLTGAGVRPMRGPALNGVRFSPKILEIGPCAKHCGDFKTAEDTHVQPRNFPQRRTPASVEFQGSWNSPSAGLDDVASLK